MHLQILTTETVGWLSFSFFCQVTVPGDLRAAVCFAGNRFAERVSLELHTSTGEPSGVTAFWGEGVRGLEDSLGAAAFFLVDLGVFFDLAGDAFFDFTGDCIFLGVLVDLLLVGVFLDFAADFLDSVEGASITGLCSDLVGSSAIGFGGEANLEEDLAAFGDFEDLADFGDFEDLAVLVEL